MLVTLRLTNALVVNRSSGASNELVVSRLTWPKNGVSAKKLDARCAAPLDALAAERLRSTYPPLPDTPGPEDASATITWSTASFRMLRRACRSRHSISPSFGLSPLSPDAAGGGSASRDADSTTSPGPPSEAGTIGGVDAAAAGTWRTAITED